jgi:flagellar hook-associated protein 1 FlgK
MRMSMSPILLSGLTGLRAAQAGIGAVTQNITNANTPGWVRTEVALSPLTHAGAGAGVDVSAIRRAADRFLATASYMAEGARGAASARAEILARAQANFGDPASQTSMFATLDDFWAALTELSVDPSSGLRRGDAINALEATFAEIQRIGGTIQDLIAEADQRIADAVDKAQDLIERIADLNIEIRLNNNTGADVTGAENAQAALIDELSAIMDVRVTPVAEGGFTVRTSGGALLVGFNAAQLAYTPNSSPYATHGVITINATQGTQSNLEPTLLSGELKGLLDVRDRDLQGLAEALAGFSAALGDALNAVHNENASSPAVSQMVGRQTGLLAADAIGFTGNAIVGLVDASGTLRERLSIDFDAQTITAEAPAGVFSFAGGSINDFVTALNAALAAAAPAGSASFSDGVLSLNVSNQGGLVIQQDGADPSSRAGRGFSHFFGLNDIVSRPTPMFFQSGVQGTDAHGLNAGGVISYQVRDSGGRLIGERTISIAGPLAAPGATWNDLLAALNAPVTGLGGYGAFALDPATGQIGFTPAAGYGAVLLLDTTLRGATGVSFTALNGLSKAAIAGRAVELNVEPLIAADSGRLAVGRPDLGVAIGDRLVEAGDNRGAAALAAARDKVRAFGAAGVLTAQSTTLAIYAARLGGEAGRMALDAERAEQGAQAVATAAADRRAKVESVTIDDELMKMTVYQNAYAASARVIQAATEMLDILITLGYRR